MVSQKLSFTFQGKQYFEGDLLPPLPQIDPPRPPHETLPTMYDLPSEFPEEPGLPDEFHDIQPHLLSRTLHLADYARKDCFMASDLNLYYDIEHPLWHKRPDWFLAVGVSRLHRGDLRRSYVTWQEKASPYVVVEFLSPGTAGDDLGRFYEKSADETAAESAEKIGKNGRLQPPGKLEVYERYLRIPHYIVYSRYTQRLRHFELVGGQYQEQPLAAGNCQIWLADLKIGLGVWEGEFEDALDHWLRWCDQAGNWLLTDTERENQAKEIERQAKEIERQAKEVAQEKLMQAARNLLETGMASEQVVELLGLSDEQRQQLNP